jgi:hypothetical protein
MHEGIRENLEDLRLVVVDTQTGQTVQISAALTPSDWQAASDCALAGGIVAAGERQPMLRWFPARPRSAKAQLAEYLETDVKTATLDLYRIPFGVRDADGKPIGVAWLHMLEPESRSLEVSYLLARDHRGKGFSSPMIAGMVELGFTLPAESVEAATYIDWYDGAVDEWQHDRRTGEQTRKVSPSEVQIRRLGFEGPVSKREGGYPHSRTKRQARYVAGFRIYENMWNDGPARGRYQMHAFRPIDRANQERAWNEVLQAIQSGDAADWQRVATTQAWAPVERTGRASQERFSMAWTTLPVAIPSIVKTRTRSRIPAPYRTLTSTVTHVDDAALRMGVAELLASKTGWETGVLGLPRLRTTQEQSYDYHRLSELRMYQGFVDVHAMSADIVALVREFDDGTRDVTGASLLRPQFPLQGIVGEKQAYLSIASSPLRTQTDEELAAIMNRMAKDLKREIDSSNHATIERGVHFTSKHDFVLTPAIGTTPVIARLERIRPAWSINRWTLPNNSTLMLPPGFSRHVIHDDHHDLPAIGVYRRGISTDHAGTYAAIGALAAYARLSGQPSDVMTLSHDDQVLAQLVTWRQLARGKEQDSLRSGWTRETIFDIRATDRECSELEHHVDGIVTPGTFGEVLRPQREIQYSQRLSNFDPLTLPIV